MRVDVSSDIKRIGEGNGLDVITQGCCGCRQERREGWRLLRRTSTAACQTKNNDFRLANKLFQLFSTTEGGTLGYYERNPN